MLSIGQQDKYFWLCIDVLQGYIAHARVDCSSRLLYDTSGAERSLLYLQFN